MSEQEMWVEDAPEIDRATAETLFQSDALPGMVMFLDEPGAVAPQAPQPAPVAPPGRSGPLLHRCDCGQVISANKVSCKACHVAHLCSIAEMVTTPEALTELLNGPLVSGVDVKAFLEELCPYLNFKPE